MSALSYDDRYRQSASSPSSPLPTDNTQSKPESLAPAAVLPEQFYAPTKVSTALHGELALMLAVLDDAFWCWQRQFATHGQRSHRLAREAECWFFSEDASWPFAFVNVCTALGLDPNYIRRGLRDRLRIPSCQASRSLGHAVSRQRRLSVAA